MTSEFSLTILLWFFYNFSQQGKCPLALLSAQPPPLLSRRLAPKHDSQAAQPAQSCPSPVCQNSLFLPLQIWIPRATLLKHSLIAQTNLSKCGEEPWQVCEAESFPFHGWPRSIDSGQHGGIMLGALPGGRLPFFCIYSALIVLWGSIRPWLTLICDWLDSGLQPGELQGWSRGWACDSTKANEHHAQGFGSNSWPQVVLPMWGKRPCKNGTSLKEKGRVEQGREMGACRYCVSHGTQARSEPERPCTSQLHATIDPLFAEAAWIVSFLPHDRKWPVWHSQSGSTMLTNTPY